jgi:hypothetical protein
MTFRKGSPRHALAGKVFVASTLTMAVFAVYLAIVRHQPNHIGGGILTFYLIGTAWLTARRRDGQTSRLDWVALLIPLVIGILTWMNGLKLVRSGATSQDGVPVGMTFFRGSVMLLAAAGDVRMLGRGGFFWSEAHRAASLAHVLCPVHRSRIFFPGTLKPPAEVAFKSGSWSASIPGIIQYDLVFNSHHTSTDLADFLASPSSLQKCLLGESQYKLHPQVLIDAVTGHVRSPTTSSRL